MIINKSISFKDFCPYIKTEETIFSLLERDRDQIPDNYELMAYPLAHWINTIGIPRTNDLIRSLKTDKTRVFVCQHIFVDKLVFEDSDIVFTPHASNKDRFICIPHYAVNFDKSLMKEDRFFEFSFMGSTTTHPTRKNLVKKYPNNCFDSKVHWGLDIGLDKNINERYIEILGNSTFSVCPRGTGISSVRLFESMAMGSIPVIVADGYEFPLQDVVNWDRIHVPLIERQALSNDLYLSSHIELYLKHTNVDNMRKEMIDIYQKYFSNENLHKTILITLCK